jgi:hypothetical protein
LIEAYCDEFSPRPPPVDAVDMVLLFAECPGDCSFEN